MNTWTESPHTPGLYIAAAGRAFASVEQLPHGRWTWTVQDRATLTELETCLWPTTTLEQAQHNAAAALARNADARPVAKQRAL